MKKLIIFLAVSLLLTIWASAQKSAPIQIFNVGELVFSMSEDSVIISGVVPVSMKCINYYRHDYDTATGVHYFGVGYQIPDGCARFDEEFSLWITEDLKYYYSYANFCEGIMLWKGNEQLATSFRSENQINSIKDYDRNNRK